MGDERYPILGWQARTQRKGLKGRYRQEEGIEKVLKARGSESE
jgi:hypothetical protein